MTILDIRDKIRYNFTKMGCPYYVPPTATYPMADHVVKPLVDSKASYAEEDGGEVENSSTVIVKRTELSDGIYMMWIEYWLCLMKNTRDITVLNKRMRLELLYLHNFTPPLRFARHTR